LRFWIPCMGTTSGTQLPPGCWMKRYIRCLEEEGKQGGYLFSRGDEKGRLRDFEESFYQLLKEVQATTQELISKSTLT